MREVWVPLSLLLIPAAARLLVRRRVSRRLGVTVGSSGLGLRAALALSGPGALYLAGALIAAITLMTRGEERETNVVDAVVDERVKSAGLLAGDGIVAVYQRPSLDGESVRRLLSWRDGAHGETRLTVQRGEGTQELIVLRPLDGMSDGLRAAPDPGFSLHTERRRVGVLAAMGRGLAFPAEKGSLIRWLVEAAVPRVRLQLRDEPLSYLPPLRPRVWSMAIADAMGIFALLMLLPWPGLDGAELLLVGYERARRRRPPGWLEGLFRSWRWGAAMAVMTVLLVVTVPRVLTYAVFEREISPLVARALFRWPG